MTAPWPNLAALTTPPRPTLSELVTAAQERHANRLRDAA